MIRVYIQELSTYNNGIAIGRWVNVSEFDSELISLFEEATEVLKEHGYYYGVDAEEYEIVDWECDVAIDLSSCYENIDSLKKIDSLLEDINDDEIDKLQLQKTLQIGHQRRWQFGQQDAKHSASENANNSVTFS